VLAWDDGHEKNLGSLAEELQGRVLKDLSDFVAGAPQNDDITLMILARDLVD